MQNLYAVKQDTRLSKLDVIENIFSIEMLYQDKDIPAGETLDIFPLNQEITCTCYFYFITSEVIKNIVRQERK